MQASIFRHLLVLRNEYTPESLGTVVVCSA
nr:MAG TPA: hypothetical protein [Caudoviricetes sp.]